MFVSHALYLPPAQTQVKAEHAAFRLREHASFANLQPDTITDTQLRRQVTALKKLGMAALTPTKLEEFTNVVNRMSGIFNTAVICPFERQDCDRSVAGETLKLDPHLYEIMDESRNYDELQYTWEQWHERAGQPMREDYAEYVALMNDAATANGR